MSSSSLRVKATAMLERAGRNYGIGCACRAIGEPEYPIELILEDC